MYFAPKEKRIGGPKGLSGMFLTSISEAYCHAKNKVMIVGSETRGWEPLAKKFDIHAPDEACQSTEGYIDRSMRVHRNFFEEELAKKSNDRGHTFHNFTRKAAKIVGGDSLVYSNLFCFDWRKSSPINSPHFEFIKNLSGKILNAQIELLQPDYIIFANGISSAKYRREFFPVGEGMRCTSSKNSSNKNVTSHYLWEFVLDKKITCFRVHHPSARSKEARVGRMYALDLLAERVST